VSSSTLPTDTAFSALETSEHRQRLLLNELNHRVKNTLATIQSIAALTARRTSTTEEFMTLFESRLIALSDTHNLLTANGWERARLRDLIQQEFRPFAEDQLRLDGPDVTLGAEQALSMSLILHELATNAAKYGALSTPDTRGRVTLKWRPVEDDEMVHLVWSEEGGPVVPPPTRRGFGSRLIETSVKGVLRGRISVDYSSGSLKCDMVFRPIDEAKSSASAAPEPDDPALEKEPRVSH
jgi:two-component sensor histidine kinase